jgi:surface antigen
MALKVLQRETMMNMRLASVVALFALLGGCADTGPKEIIGGAVLGGGAGYGCARFVKGQYAEYIAVGCTLGGAIVGSQIGKSLDHADTAYARPVPQQVSASSTPPAPVYTYQRVMAEPQDMTICRPYESSIEMNGAVYRTYGQSCRQADGSWMIVK